MDFKKLYQEALEKAGSPGNLSQESFINYRNKYANATKSQSLKNIMAGKIFTFYYKSDLKDENGFINRRPILFILSDGLDISKKIIYGIDLMLLTPRNRLTFIIRLLTLYGKSIDDNIRRKETHGETSQSPIKISLDIMETLFQGIDYKYTYSGFKIEHIQRLIEIPIEDWVNIVYLNTKSVEGQDIEEIYKKHK